MTESPKADVDAAPADAATPPSDNDAQTPATNGGVPAPMNPPVHVIYASETGTAEEFATLLHSLLSSHLPCTLSCASSVTLPLLRTLAADRAVALFVVATAGEGAAPRTLRDLWRSLLPAALPADTLRGLRVGVLGLGDSSYALFNAAARRLRARLSDLGPDELTPAVLADDADVGGAEPAADRFGLEVAEALGIDAGAFADTRAKPPRPRAEIVLDPAEKKDDGHVRAVDMWRPDEALSGETKGEAAWTDALVVENRPLTDSAFLEDDREVRHIVLDVSSAPDDSLISRLSPGDVLRVLPRNRASAVSALLYLYNWDPSSLVRLSSGSASHLNASLPARLDELLASSIDLGARVRRRFLERLAPFATSAREADRLCELSDPEGADEFATYAANEMRTPLIVLRDFPSARPPVGDLVDMLPPMRSRAFSVAGIPEEGRVEICAAIARFVTPLRFARVGIASAHFERAEAGAVLPVRAERGPAPAVDVPAILIAAGAGAAFIRPIASAGTYARLLFYGCRHPDGDFLYGDEWKALEEAGRLTLFTAFSRVNKEKVYVQHRMREQRKLVWEWIHRRGAAVYVSGAAGGFPREVRRTIVDIVAEEGGMEAREAARYVRRMETGGRMIVECW